MYIIDCKNSEIDKKVLILFDGILGPKKNPTIVRPDRPVCLICRGYLKVTQKDGRIEFEHE